MEKPKVKFEKTRAHQRYKLKDGTVVPGATTVLNVMDKGEALLNWAYECGLRNEDFRKARDQAADIGTLAHFLCECHLNGTEADLSEFSPSDRDKAENSFLKFLEWWDSQKMQKLACTDQHGKQNVNEVELVSEKWKFGGTIDLPCRDRDGKKVLADFKTSKAIYPKSMFSQLAAYNQLYAETEEGKKDPFVRWIIVRIGKKEAGDFEVREVTKPQLDAHWKVFEACLALHKALKGVKD